MRWSGLIALLFAASVHGQIVQQVVMTAHPASAMTVTAHLGGTATGIGNDSGNGGFVFETPLTIPSGVTGLTWDTVLHFAVASPQNSPWGIAVYTDHSGAVDGGSLICSFSSSSTPSSGDNSVASNCSTVPVAGGSYWVTTITNSNTQQQVYAGNAAACATGKFSNFSNLALTPFPAITLQTNGWPNTFPALGHTQSNSCYQGYVNVNYTTTAPIVVNGAAFATAGSDLATATVGFPPTASGHGLACDVQIYGENTTTNFGTLTTSASQSMTKQTQGGAACTGTQVNNFAQCWYTLDNPTAGTNSVTFTTTDTAYHPAITCIETQGTASSSSVDQVQYDTSAHATPFTGPNVTPTAAPEVGLCGVANTQFEAIGSPGTYTPGSGWAQIAFGQNNAASVSYVYAIFANFTSNTSTYQCTGSYSISGTDNLTGTITKK